MSGSTQVALGAQVQITKGPDRGVVGWVFWQGRSKMDTERKRYGLKTGEGQAFWADEHALEVVAPAPTHVSIDKGTRVRVAGQDGRDQLGEVFWVGVSRARPPMPRYGVRSDRGETFFVDHADVEELH
ncbi:MAG: hypothetical protein AAGE52_16370 [Myxococcota bacterium]